MLIVTLMLLLLQQMRLASMRYDNLYADTNFQLKDFQYNIEATHALDTASREPFNEKDVRLWGQEEPWGNYEKYAKKIFPHVRFTSLSEQRALPNRHSVHNDIKNKFGSEVSELSRNKYHNGLSRASHEKRGVDGGWMQEELKSYESVPSASFRKPQRHKNTHYGNTDFTNIHIQNAHNAGTNNVNIRHDNKNNIEAHYENTQNKNQHYENTNNNYADYKTIKNGYINKTNTHHGDTQKQKPNNKKTKNAHDKYTRYIGIINQDHVDSHENNTHDRSTHESGAYSINADNRKTDNRKTHRSLTYKRGDTKRKPFYTHYNDDMSKDNHGHGRYDVRGTPGQVYRRPNDNEDDRDVDDGDDDDDDEDGEVYKEENDDNDDDYDKEFKSFEVKNAGDEYGKNEEEEEDEDEDDKKTNYAMEKEKKDGKKEKNDKDGEDEDDDLATDKLDYSKVEDKEGVFQRFKGKYGRVYASKQEEEERSVTRDCQWFYLNAWFWVVSLLYELAWFHVLPRLCVVMLVCTAGHVFSI